MKKRKNIKCILCVCFCSILAAGCGSWSHFQHPSSFAEHVVAKGQVEQKKEQIYQKKTEGQQDMADGESGKSEEQKEAIADVSSSIQKVMNIMPEEFMSGYLMDESFFLWLSGEYGEESIFALQEAVSHSKPDVESWYRITGKSVHVLWMEYCFHTGLYPDYVNEKVYEKECASKNQVILDFTGDINLAEGCSTTEYLDGQPGGIQDCFSPALLEEMRNADILMINNEFTFSTRGEPLPGKSYTFRANPKRIHVLQELETDILSLANNHVFDFGEEALLDTLDTIENAQIPYVGAGRNLEEAMKPVYFIANGRKIAIVSATQIERSTNYTKEATETSAGVLKTLNPDKFLTVIEEAKRQSDYAIVFVHWGTENTNHYGSDQTELGKAFIDAGVDVVVGGHTHCLQGFAFYNGKPVIYSLGNFWFNNRTLDTGLFQMIIHTDSNQTEFRFLPCIQKGCVTSLTEDPNEKQRILNFMQQISAPGVAVDSEGYVTEQ